MVHWLCSKRLHAETECQLGRVRFREMVFRVLTQDVWYLLQTGLVLDVVQRQGSVDLWCHLVAHDIWPAYGVVFVVNVDVVDWYFQ